MEIMIYSYYNIVYFFVSSIIIERNIISQLYNSERIYHILLLSWEEKNKKSVDIFFYVLGLEWLFRTMKLTLCTAIGYLIWFIVFCIYVKHYRHRQWTRRSALSQKCYRRSVLYRRSALAPMFYRLKVRQISSVDNNTDITTKGTNVLQNQGVIDIIYLPPTHTHPSRDRGSTTRFCEVPYSFVLSLSNNNCHQEEEAQAP